MKDRKTLQFNEEVEVLRCDQCAAEVVNKPMNLTGWIRVDNLGINPELLGPPVRYPKPWHFHSEDCLLQFITALLAPPGPPNPPGPPASIEQPEAADGD